MERLHRAYNNIIMDLTNKDITVENHKRWRRRYGSSILVPKIREGGMTSIFQFTIILVVVVGVLVLACMKILRPQDVTGLYGMIIGYLLGKGSVS